MSENWTREDMVRLMGSEKAADMAKLAADALARLEEVEAQRDKLIEAAKWVSGDPADGALAELHALARQFDA